MPTEKLLAEELAHRLERTVVAGPIESGPDASSEVADLEHLARRIVSAADVRPSPAFAMQARQRLLRAIEAGRPRHPTRAPLRIGPSLVWASALAGAMLVCLAGAGGVSYAAAASLPGDVLFPAKSAFEQAVLNVAPDASARAGLGLEITQRRLSESDKLLDLGRTAHAAEAFEAAAASLERSADLLEAVDLPSARDDLAGQLALLLPRVEKAVAEAARSNAPEMRAAMEALTRAGRHAVEVGNRVGPQHKFEFHGATGEGGHGVDKSKHTTSTGDKGRLSKAKGRGPQRTRTPKKPAGPPLK